MANPAQPQSGWQKGGNARVFAWSSLIIVVSSVVQLSRCPKKSPAAVKAAALLSGFFLVGLGMTVPLLWHDHAFLNITTNMQLCVFLMRGFEMFFSGKVYTHRPNGKAGVSTAAVGLANGRAEDDTTHSFGETLAVFVNQRKIGLPYQVKKIAPFSYKDPKWVPGRKRFVMTLLIRLAVFWLIMDGVENLPGQPDAAIFAKERTHFFSRLSDVTADQVVQAMASTAMNWVLAYIIITIQADALQLVGTLIGAYAPADCPPTFGRLRDAYSVRQFWGVAWHQQLRFLADIAEYLSDDVLRVPRGTLVSRYGKMYATYLLSGAMHAASETAAFNGRTWAESHSLWFFSMQWLGTVIEDAAQELYRRVFGRCKTQEPVGWQRMLGYLWTFLWLSYTTPRYVYAAARHPTAGICAIFFDPIRMYLKRNRN